MAAQTAKYECNSAWLGKDFGRSLAGRLFPDVNFDELPTNSKGKYAGQSKVTLEWVKCVEGGWVYAEQRVDRRVNQIIGARLVVRPFRGPIQVLHESGETRRLEV